jgi:hypothetical protein
MSAYLNLPVQISTMVCRTCGTGSFAWLAEIFVCPVCGDHDYVFPMFATEFDLASAARAGEVDGDTTDSIAGLQDQCRKRKRADSSDGSDEW